MFRRLHQDKAIKCKHQRVREKDDKPGIAGSDEKMTG